MNTKVCTRLRLESERSKDGVVLCFYCGAHAGYWTQIELHDGKAGSGCIFHCQRCRNKARRDINKIDVKVTLKG